ncbi:MAG: gamma-glutamylcyclotransferase family protein [Bacteroidia bacterium]
MEKELTENLFSYGTLQQEAVQLAIFNRLLIPCADELLGYTLEMIEIKDEAVLAKSGLSHHPILKHTGNNTDCIKGSVFVITKKELHQADEYEVDDYKRIAVQLKSDKTAWVYVSV